MGWGKQARLLCSDRLERVHCLSVKYASCSILKQQRLEASRARRAPAGCEHNSRRQAAAAVNRAPLSLKATERATMKAV